MSLWGSKTICYLLFFTVAVGGGCASDELSSIPFNKSADRRINMQYKEFGIPSGVMLADSIHAGRNALLQSSKRIMVGRYIDDKFGTVRAQAYTEFQPDHRIVKIEKNAKLVSGFLILGFDYYEYGSKGVTKNTFTVHELTKEVKSNRDNFVNSDVEFNPDSIGKANYFIDDQLFTSQRKRIDDAESIKIDEIDSVAIALSDAFISKLFEAARDQTDDYVSYSNFRTAFPGLAILPSDTDTKIVGFDMDNNLKKLSKSKIVLNYDELDTATNKDVRKQLTYSLYDLNDIPLNGFTQVSTDRKNTPLSSITSTYTESNLMGMRYYQSGGAIVPLIDFSQFIARVDTIPNIIFSSVELSIKVENADQFTPPKALHLRLLNERNQFISSTAKSYFGALTYIRLISFDEWGKMIIGTRQATANITGSLLRLVYDEASSSYHGDFTNLFQTLRYAENKIARPKRFGIVAQIPWMGMSVNRFWFKSENIKLKVFYAIPKKTL